MTTDFEKIEKVSELLEKEAFVGAIAGAAAGAIGKGAWGLGKTVIKNPVASLNVMDVSGNALNTSKDIGESKMNAALNINAAPTGPTF